MRRLAWRATFGVSAPGEMLEAFAQDDAKSLPKPGKTMYKQSFRSVNLHLNLHIVVDVERNMIPHEPNK